MMDFNNLPCEDKIYYKDDDCIIYCADCREILPLIPDKSIDLVLTSPPYNIGLKYGDMFSDKLSSQEYLDFTSTYMRHSHNVLADDGRFCLNIGYRVATVTKAGIDYFDVLDLAKRAGYKMRETIIWVKTREPENAQNFCGSNTAWGSWLSPSNPVCRARMEFVFVLNKDVPGKIHRGITDLTKQEFFDFSSNVWYFPAETVRKHTAPFPIELPRRCIKFFTWVNDIIIDPFLGSGTTAIAAKKLGRKCIGIEIEEKYCEIAKNRLAQSVMRLE